MWNDVRYALRAMRRSPGFTAVAVLSLALGIGANTAIFSLIYTLMLHMLPVRDPRQLVELLRTFPGDPPVNAFSQNAYRYFRDHNHVFSAIIAEGGEESAVRRPGMQAEPTHVGYASGDFF